MGQLTRRRCKATNRLGEPCGVAPIPGGDVCPYHGGNAPQVRQAAQRKLLRAADYAIDYLLSILEPRPPCPECGRSDADKDPTVVRACQLVLDRSGFHPTLAIQAAPRPEPSLWARWLTEEQLSLIGGCIEDAKRRMADGYAPTPELRLTASDTVDAVLAEDADDSQDASQPDESHEAPEASPAGLVDPATGPDA